MTRQPSAGKPAAMQPCTPAGSSAGELIAQVLAGLKRPQKELSPVWFYDELGSRLFDRICELPEYYLTRAEIAIMRKHAAAMAQYVGRDATIIEFGSGTSLKTRLLLDQIAMPATYVPVDIAREHLLDAAATIARDYPDLRVVPVCADFTTEIDLSRHVSADTRRVVYFPGSTIGNFERSQARELLTSIRRIVGSDGGVLVGVDLRKDPRVLERAYNDEAGVNAEFNINMLRHLNRELGADFDLDAFEHAALWIDRHSRIEMHLISKSRQQVHIGDEQIELARGEHIRTEYSHKYTLEGFADLAAAADLAVERVWTDEEQRFSVQWLAPHRLQ
jgi:L-histidine N-alpha-methyltransferase